MVIDCPFSELCRFCNDRMRKICCLYQTYIKGAYKNCKKIKLCPNLLLCENALNGNLQRMSIFYKVIPNLNDISSFKYKVKTPCKGFKSRFIPRVELYGENSKEQIKIIKSIGIKTIAVSLRNIISNKEDQLIKDRFKEDLHKILDFDGKILLHTNIPDSYCIKIMKNIEEYKIGLKHLKPDIITTFDANFYLDQPLFITAIQLSNILLANHSLSELDIPQVFLIPLVHLQFFEAISKVFLNSNHISLCIPFEKFNKSELSFIFNLMKKLKEYKEIFDKKFKILLISKNPDNKMEADYYSSLTWAKCKKRKKEKKLIRTIKKANQIKFQKSLISYIK